MRTSLQRTRRTAAPEKKPCRGMPLVRPTCDHCGATMIVYTTRTNGSGIVRYWKCWRKDCKFRKKKNGG